MWKSIKTPAAAVLIFSVSVALGISAAILWLRFASRPDPIFVPGPTSVQTVYKPKWLKPGKPEVRLVPVQASIAFFDRESLVKESKIQDAPDNVVAVGQVPPHSGKTTVFATLTPDADNVLRGGLEYRQEKTPFFQVKREMGLRGGYGSEGIVGEVYVRPLRIGPGDVEARVYGNSGNGTDAGKVGAAILFDMRF